VNVLNVAQSYIVASAATQALFGTDLAAFATQGWLTPKTPGVDGGTGAGNSWTLSASELVSGMLGQGFGMHPAWGNDSAGVRAAIMKNIRENGPRALGTMIVTPIAFNVAKKLTSTPRRDINRFLKMGNLSSVVKV
jgi:hypothetical protein